MAFSTFKITFADDLGFEVVDVFVGPDRKRYVVHKKLLTEQSEYFHKALTGSFMEAEENSIHLKEEDPAAVALLVGWLYRGVIPGTENLSTAFLKSIFSSPKTIEIPTSEHGTSYPFSPIPQPANSGFFGTDQADTFQHICHQSQYTIFSPEELRLADYKLNQKYLGDPSAFPTLNPPPQQLNGGLFGNPASLFFQPAPPQTGGLFGNTGTGTSIFAGPAGQATGGTFANARNPSSASVQPGSQTNGGLFGGAVSQVSQPALSVAQPSNPPQTQPANMFAARYGPMMTSQQSNNPSTVTPVSQAQSLFGGANTSTAGPNNPFGGHVSANQPRNLFSSLSNSTAQPQSSNLFGGLGSFANQTSNGSNAFSFAGPQASGTQASSLFGTATHSSAPIGGLFGASSGATTNNSPASGGLFGASALASNPSHIPTTGMNVAVSQAHAAQIPSLFGIAPPTTTPAGGLFGNLHPHNNPHRSNLFGGFGPVLPTLPPGAVMTAIEPQKPKPGEFGYYPSITHTKSPGHFIKGIPRSDASNGHFFDLENHQLALLNLCIMAETLCWPKLFNEAINAYIRGEHKLQRPVSLDFIDRIYTRTHADSTLRAYVIDSLSRMKSEGVADLNPYLEMATKHADLLADLFSKIMDSSKPIEEVTDKTIKNYHMYGMDDDSGRDDASNEHTDPNDIL